MLTSGAMTNRLDRLEAAGLVRRDRNPDDRRGVHVVLTERGRELVDQAIAVRFDEATDAVTVLNEREREEAAALLAKLLSHLEQDEAGAP
jgi:DNA-binding MarR family transcriptional regulator